MIVRTSVGWCAVGILVAGSLLLSGNPPEPQKESPKELAKEAQTDEDNGKWEPALEKLKRAAARKPKDQKIAQALTEAEEYLANQAANQAIASCNEQKLDTCEQKVKLALSYARTPRALEAQNQLAADKAQVQARWEKAQQMIGSGRLDEANAELEALSQFSYLFPTLSAEKAGLRTMRISAALALGKKDLDQQQFDAARQAFGAAVSLDPGNAEAAHGIDTAQKGKEAFGNYQQAKDAFSAKKYEEAYLSNQNALRLFPDQKEYQDLDKQISADWLPVLEDDNLLNPKPDDLKGNQGAWASLGWIRRLDPDYKGLEGAKSRINTNLYNDYIQKANEFKLAPNSSGVATAFLYNLNAQQRNPNPGGEDPFAANYREVSSLFDRKRAMLALVSVRTLAPVEIGFPGVVYERVRSPIEAQGLRDLKVSALDDYERNPPHPDPLFQDSRADGKSSIVLLNVDITNFETESTGNDKPEEKTSKFVSGPETVDNPDYDKVVTEYRNVSDELARNKHKNKPTKEHHYTMNDQVILQQKMQATPPTITRDKTEDYTYQEYHRTASAHITMHLEFRDMLDKELLGSDDVDIRQQDKADEVAGVHEKDVNGLINRPARIKTPDELLKEAELDALKALDAKVPVLLAKFTDRYYNAGERELGELRTNDALENFLCYWYTFGGQFDKKRSDRIREVVKLYTGLDL
jgi:hypothetical protein